MRVAGSTAGAAVTVATSSSPYRAYAFHGADAADGDWAIQLERILTPNLPVSLYYLI